LFCAGPPAVRAAERPPGPAVAVGGIHGVWGDRGPHGGASDQHAPRLLDARGDRRLALRHSVVGQVHRHAHTYTHTHREREMHMTTISFHSFRCFYFLELSDRFRSCIHVLRYVYYNVIMAAAGMSLGRTSRSRETTDFQSQWRDRWACNAISASTITPQRTALRSSFAARAMPGRDPRRI
jgi:hypothetical protein